MRCLPLTRGSPLSARTIVRCDFTRCFSRASTSYETTQKEQTLLAESFESDSVVVLTLNRPRQRNALNTRLLVELEEQLLKIQVLLLFNLPLTLHHLLADKTTRGGR